MSTISQFTPAKLKAWIELYSAGATGPEGPEGPQGPAGSDGADGADGADGDQGPAGADGTDGTNGTDGTDGIDGIDGNDGAPGADGVDGEDGDTMWDTVTGGISYTGGNADVSGNITAPTFSGALSGNATTATSATQLDGLVGNTSSVMNTVAVRDGSAHLRCNYLFSAYTNMSHNQTTRNADTVFYSSTDTYIRKNTKAGYKTSLFSDSDLTFARGGGWYMSDTTWLRVRGNKTVYNASSSANAFTTPGDFTAGYSDMRLKTHKGKIEDALDKVCTLDGFYYERNEKAIELGYEGGELRVGLSAQQVKEVLPEIIKSAPINIDHGTDYMTLDYERVVPLLVEAIKELKAEVEELKNGTSS